MKIFAFAAAALIAVLAQPALAESISTTRQGAAGGTLTRETSCAGSRVVGRCGTDWGYTNPAGATWTGDRTTAVGRWRGGQRSSVTGPNGKTVERGRVWRR